MLSRIVSQTLSDREIYGFMERFSVAWRLNEGGLIARFPREQLFRRASQKNPTQPIRLPALSTRHTPHRAARSLEPRTVPLRCLHAWCVGPGPARFRTWAHAIDGWFGWMMGSHLQKWNICICLQPLGWQLCSKWASHVTVSDRGIDVRTYSTLPDLRQNLRNFRYQCRRNFRYCYRYRNNSTKNGTISDNDIDCENGRLKYVGRREPPWTNTEKVKSTKTRRGEPFPYWDSVLAVVKCLAAVLLVND